MKTAMLIPVLLLAGCQTMTRYQTVQVPVRVSCVSAVPQKPVKLTPCPTDITDSQCVKRAAIDIERMESAVDQLTEIVKACQ